MALSLILFECRYHFSRISFIALTVIFTALGLLFAKNGLGPASMALDSPYHISMVFGFLSLLFIFAVMVFSANAMIRDHQHRMESLIYSSPVSKLTFLFSRFGGVYLASFVIFFFTLAGFLLGVYFPFGEAELLSGTPWTSIVGHIGIFVLPNLLSLTAILFLIAALSRNLATTFTGGLFIYFMYWVCALYFNSPILANTYPASPAQMQIAALFDPTGLSAFFEQTTYWTIPQQNAQSLQFEGNLLWNRALWTLISLLCMSATYFIFSFQEKNRKVRKSKKEPINPVKSKDYCPVKTNSYSSKSRWVAYRSLTRTACTTTYKSLTFAAFTLLWIVVVVSEIYPKINGGGEYGSSLYPFTYLLTELIQDPLSKLGVLLMIFYSGELYWREKNVGISPIIDATPVSGYTVFLSKLLTLLFIPFFMITTGIVISIGFQFAKGYELVEYSLYFSMYYYLGIPLLLFGLLSLCIQFFSSNKYIGMLISGLAFAFSYSPLSSKFGISHHLLKFATAPALNYSMLNGYGSSNQAFPWFMLYWGLFSLIILVLTDYFKKRKSAQNHAFPKFTVAFSLIFFFLTGGYIFYNTNVLNRYETPDDTLAFKAGYERTYKSFEPIPQPAVTDIKTEIDLYPKERKYVVRGNYTLENKTTAPIQKVLVNVRREVTVRSLTLDNLKHTEHDARYGTYWFVLKEPLHPGETMQMHYEVEKTNPGFENEITDNRMMENGTFLMHRYFEPSIGYRQTYEIHDPLERKKRSLPKKKPQPTEDHLANTESTYGFVNFETILSTASDQTAIAPGKLLRRWTQNDRQYFHYKTRQPINNTPAYFSGRYQMIKQTYKGINIELYAHPLHSWNTERMISATKTALEYCQQAYGTYPLDHLRIVESPSHHRFAGYAIPGIITLVEDRGFLTDLRQIDAMDIVSKRIAHEVAHQWWGHQVTPLIQPGATMIVESLAKYTELMVIEKLYGKENVKQLLEYERHRYFSERSQDDQTEVPLSSVEHQSYLYYRKGGLAFYSLKQKLGEKTVNKALQAFVQAYAYPKPAGNSSDLLQKLYEANNYQQIGFIDKWLKNTVTSDLKIENLSYTKNGEDNYTLKLSVKASKFEWKNNDKISLSLNDTLLAGLYSENKPLKIIPLYVDQKDQEFTINTDHLPEYITLDPDLWFLDQNRHDNVLERVDFQADSQRL